MKITEKMLLDGYCGVAKGGNYMSNIGAIMIWWWYRKRTKDGSTVVCSRGQANLISLEFDRTGEIEIDNSLDGHPAIKAISYDEEKFYGVEIP